MLAAVSVGNSLQRGLNSIFGYLPDILGCLAILLIGYLLAVIVRAVVTKALTKAGVDERSGRSPVGRSVVKISPEGKPSSLFAAGAFWLVFAYAVTAAVAELHVPSLTAFMRAVLGYIPNVIAAALILLVAAGLCGLVGAMIKRTMGGTPTAKVVGSVAPALIMVIAVFMVLTELQIAPDIVMITYAALVAMLAFTGVLAFGLGGREVAARMWSNAYDKSQEATEQVRIDLRSGNRSAEPAAGDPFTAPMGARSAGGDNGQYEGAPPGAHVPPRLRDLPPPPPAVG